MSFKRHFITIIILVLCSCSSSNVDVNAIDVPTDPTTSTPNILLIIADDMGLDATPNYSEGTMKPNMRNLQALMNTGITFENLWSYPVCSPTRASILTGKYGSKTGVLAAGDFIDTTETSLQKYIDDGTSNAYASAVIGKWHLSNSGLDPATMGIDYFAGVIKGSVQSYTNWSLNINGQSTISKDYTTTKFTDLAIDWVGNQSKPWFLWLAYNAPHTPFHLAPTNLHSQGSLPTDAASIDANPMPYFMSAIEAMDSEIGRLLNSMSAEEKVNTIIVFIGDNGSPNQVAQAPYSRSKSKNSMYQGGVNVPMVVSGFGVNRAGDRESALISTTDLFATIASVAGVSTSTKENSTSFYPLLTNSSVTSRDYVYTEISNNGIGYAIRNTTYKLFKYESGVEAFYNLTTDAYESSNLIGTTLSSEASIAKAGLEAEAMRIRS
jgi:arylsulfatase A-like enzyme